MFGGKKLPSLYPARVAAAARLVLAAGKHLAYFVSDVIDNLDLSAVIDAVYGKREARPAAVRPLDDDQSVVFSYCVSVQFAGSNAAWWKTSRSGCWRQAINPTSARFRISAKFFCRPWEVCSERVLHIALVAGAMKVGRVALDGT